jgi:hypothetical protein
VIYGIARCHVAEPRKVENISKIIVINHENYELPRGLFLAINAFFVGVEKFAFSSRFFAEKVFAQCNVVEM